MNEAIEINASLYGQTFRTIKTGKTFLDTFLDTYIQRQMLSGKNKQILLS